MGPRRRRLASAERGTRFSQKAINLHRERMLAAKHATRDPIRVLERRYGLAKIVERGGGVRPRVIQPHRQRDFITVSEDALGHGYR